MVAAVTGSQRSSNVAAGTVATDGAGNTYAWELPGTGQQKAPPDEGGADLLASGKVRQQQNSGKDNKGKNVVGHGVTT